MKRFTTKELIQWVCFLTAIVTIVCALVIVIKKPHQRTANYPTIFKIVKVNTETDNVTGIDANGNFWQWTGVEDLAVNDLVAVTMNDKGTKENVYDDEVIDVKYCGTTQDF